MRLSTASVIAGGAASNAGNCRSSSFWKWTLISTYSPYRSSLKRIDVVDVGAFEPFDARHDRLVVVDHGRGGVGEAEECGPLRVEHLFLGLGVRDEGAA